jgi:hypothetical protein
VRLGRCSCAQRRFGCPLHMAQGGRRKASPSLWRTSARPNPSTGSARAGSPTVTTGRHGRGVSMVAAALTAGRPAEPNCSSSHGGPFRSGSARLGRSQKDGLPSLPWGDICRFKAIDARTGHRLPGWEDPCRRSGSKRNPSGLSVPALSPSQRKAPAGGSRPGLRRFKDRACRIGSDE